MQLFDVTFDIVTEESSEDGMVSEAGFIVEDERLRDAIRAVSATESNTTDGHNVDANETNGRIDWVTVSHGMDWITGQYETRYLHIPETVTPASSRRIARLVGARV